MAGARATAVIFPWQSAAGCVTLARNAGVHTLDIILLDTDLLMRGTRIKLPRPRALTHLAEETGVDVCMWHYEARTLADIERALTFPTLVVGDATCNPILRAVYAQLGGFMVTTISSRVASEYQDGDDDIVNNPWYTSRRAEFLASFADNPDISRAACVSQAVLVI